VWVKEGCHLDMYKSNYMEKQIFRMLILPTTVVCDLAK